MLQLQLGVFCHSKTLKAKSNTVDTVCMTARSRLRQQSGSHPHINLVSASLNLFLLEQDWSGQVWTCSFLFNQVCSCLDKCGLVHSCSIKFVLVWTSLNLFISNYKHEILRITNMKFQELPIWNSKNNKYEIPRITNM